MIKQKREKGKRKQYSGIFGKERKREEFTDRQGENEDERKVNQGRMRREKTKRK